jgi:hypothetical protein
MYGVLCGLGLIQHSCGGGDAIVDEGDSSVQCDAPAVTAVPAVISVPTCRDRALDRLCRQHIWEAMGEKSLMTRMKYKPWMYDVKKRTCERDEKSVGETGKTFVDLAPVYSESGSVCLKGGSAGGDVELAFLSTVLNVDIIFWEDDRRSCWVHKPLDVSNRKHDNWERMGREYSSYVKSTFHEVSALEDVPAVHIIWSGIVEPHVDAFRPKSGQLQGYLPPLWLTDFLSDWNESES